MHHLKIYLVKFKQLTSWQIITIFDTECIYSFIFLYVKIKIVLFRLSICGKWRSLCLHNNHLGLHL